MNKKKFISLFKRVIYLTLPVIILIIIFNKIDFEKFLESLTGANVYLIIVGICLRPLQIVIGAFRWRLLTNFYYSKRMPSKYLTYHYWAGLTIGYFTPGNLGWDAYRILIVGRKNKSYIEGFFSIITEKFIGLFSVLLMIIITFPIVYKFLNTDYSFLLSYYYIFVFVCILVVIVWFFIYYKKTSYLERIKLHSKALLIKLINRVKNEKVKTAILAEYDNSPNIFILFNKPKFFIFILLLSMAVLTVAAVCSQFIFQGLNYEVNFFINLFAAPVFFILFLIPISFGSIGVREGAFILLYGLFGVPMEIALLVSFFNLFGLFLNNIIGAIIMFRRGLQKKLS